MTQNAKLLVYLESHDGITTLEAMSALKICRLSERIRELETLGYRFRHDQETTPHGARVTRYRLQKAAAQVADGSLTTAKAQSPVEGQSPASAAPSEYTVGQQYRMFGRRVLILADGISEYDGTRYTEVRDLGPWVL